MSTSRPRLSASGLIVSYGRWSLPSVEELVSTCCYFESLLALTLLGMLGHYVADVVLRAGTEHLWESFRSGNTLFREDVGVAERIARWLLAMADQVDCRLPRHVAQLKSRDRV